MLNTVYQLTEPRKIETCFKNIDLTADQVLIRPLRLSICHADQRYYQGSRSPEVLAKKLPMALIHEGIGVVQYDSKGIFKPGDKVVMIPNTPTEEDPVIAENYLRSSRFRSSGMDGFMQDHVALDHSRVLPLPDSIDESVAAFMELVSVSVHALSRFDRFAHIRREKVGIWGDGNLAYITALLFRYMFPDTDLYIFGLNRDKLSLFSFAKKTFDVRSIPQQVSIDHAIECVGGEGSQQAIAQIIDHINPQGTISLLGVSEYPVPILTRMVLEKGLCLFGSSRSGRADFQRTIELYTDHPELVGYLANLINAEVEINSVADIHRAFYEDINKPGGKTILHWNI